MIDVGVVLRLACGRVLSHPRRSCVLPRPLTTRSLWSHVWVTDSVISLPFYDSVVLLAACAARTSRGAPGRGLRGEPRTAPSAHRGSQWANLDVLSGGRMNFRRLSRGGGRRDTRARASCFQHGPS